MPLNPPCGALARSHLSSPPSLNPAEVKVGGRGTPANIDDMHDAYHATVSAAQPAAAAAAPGDAGSSSSSRPPSPKLLLDSGASIHVVGDARLLSNLRDAPAGMRIRVANGSTLPVTKIGDIQMTNFTIPGVHLAPGLESDLISVRQLTMRRICTWFDGDRVVLYAGSELVGEAVAPKENLYGLYVLQFLSVPKIAAAASSSGNNGLLDNGEFKLVPVWCGSGSARRSFGSVLCPMKVLLRAKRLFSEGPREKPMREKHVSNIIQRKGKNSDQGEGDDESCWRTD